MSAQQIVIPDIGDVEEVDVIEICVAVGDTVDIDDTVVVLETDKASMEIPAIEKGVVTHILVNEGDKVSEGSVIATFEACNNITGSEPAENNSVESVSAADDATGIQSVKNDESGKASLDASTVVSADNSQASTSIQRASSLTKAPLNNEVSGANVHAGPAVRRLAAELGVDLGSVTGTGPKGRILKEDVHQYVKSVLSNRNQTIGNGVTNSGLPELPVIDFSKFGAVEEKALTKIQKVSAKNLHRSWVHIPHVTQFDEADITELEVFRKEQSTLLKPQGIKLTPLAFFVKALSHTLLKFPKFCSSLDASQETLILKKFVNIGIAVDTPNGLVVPVIKNADKLSITEIAQEMTVLSVKAREKKLSPSDMQGACMTISSLGGIGGTAFTPIVNWPEVAILGISKSYMKPVYKNEAFEPRLTLPLSLSYDHRVIDGADAARFTSYLADLLGDIRKTLL